MGGVGETSTKARFLPCSARRTFSWCAPMLKSADVARRSHTRTERSYDDEASNVGADGDHTTALTQAVWPESLSLTTTPSGGYAGA